MNRKTTCAEKAIRESRILETLKDYSPEVVSTIFVGLDTKGSDIDIVCSYQEQKAFVTVFNSTYSSHESYTLDLCREYAVGRFQHGGFLFEVYASNIPVKCQKAYRHYQVMRRLVKIGGDNFARNIRELKQNGLKTEPAICHFLELSGEPFTAVLKLENWSDQELKKHIARYI